jgi:serine protease
MFTTTNKLCMLAAALSMAASSHGAVRLVPQNYSTIQAGINAAMAGDIVLVADGVYSGAGNRDISLMGKAITLQSLNGPQATIIDVQGTPQVWHTAFNLHMQETPAARIQGFTIKNGYTFDGAAIHMMNSSPTITNCVFMDNHAVCWGAAMYFDNCNSSISDCVFKDNVCDADGGAVFGFNGAPTFTNCLFASNTAANSAGAILTWGSAAPKLINSTVVGNSAPWGSAVYSNNLKISNSIIWGNSGAQQQIATPSGNTLSVKYSIVQGGFAGIGNLNAEPQFVDAAGGDFHLAQGSPGIDIGDPALKPNPGEIDLDGDPRVFGSAVDMGIDEFRKSGDVDGDHAVNVNDLLQVIAQWGPCSWSTADLNGDFSVNVNDLILVIAGWE